MPNFLCRYLTSQLSAPPGGYLEGYKALYVSAFSAVMSEMKYQTDQLPKNIYIMFHFGFVGN